MNQQLLQSLASFAKEQEIAETITGNGVWILGGKTASGKTAAQIFEYKHQDGYFQTFCWNSWNDWNCSAETNGCNFHDLTCFPRIWHFCFSDTWAWIHLNEWILFPIAFHRIQFLCSLLESDDIHGWWWWSLSGKSVFCHFLRSKYKKFKLWFPAFTYCIAKCSFWEAFHRLGFENQSSFACGNKDEANGSWQINKHNAFIFMSFFRAFSQRCEIFSHANCALVSVTAEFQIRTFYFGKGELSKEKKGLLSLFQEIFTSQWGNISFPL